MITPDGSLVYIENFRLLSSFLNNSEPLAKKRTKVSNDTYAVNGLIAKKMGDIWAVSLVAPERLKPKTWLLTGDKTLNEFKGLFGEILTNTNILLPYFLEVSSSIDDNIFINLEVKNFLNKIFEQASGFKEES